MWYVNSFVTKKNESDLQAVYGFACNEVLIDDFVDIGMIDVLVPGFFRIDDQHGPILAAVQAACGVDADLSWPANPQLLAALLGVVA